MTSGIVTGLFSPLCGVIFHGEGDPEKSPAHFTGKHSAGPSTEPFHTCTVPKRKNGFGTVQKFIFYGSNFRKCHSEPYFSWRDTVEKLKILFLTVPDSQNVRLYNVDPHFKPYRSILPGVKQGFSDMGKEINCNISPVHEKQRKRNSFHRRLWKMGLI